MFVPLALEMPVRFTSTLMHVDGLSKTSEQDVVPHTERALQLPKRSYAIFSVSQLGRKEQQPLFDKRHSSSLR